MGSDESHFNVSLIVRDKFTKRLCPQTTTFLKKKDSGSGIEVNMVLNVHRNHKAY